MAERLSRRFPIIRLTVTQAAEQDSYRELIADSLKGIGITYQLESVETVSLREQEVEHLLEACDETREIARHVGASVVLRQHRP